MLVDGLRHFFFEPHHSITDEATRDRARMLHIAVWMFLTLWSGFVILDLLNNGVTLWLPNVVLAYGLPCMIFILSKCGSYKAAAWIASFGFPASIFLTIVLEVPIHNFVLVPAYLIPTLLCVSFLLKPFQAIFVAIFLLLSQFAWAWFDPRLSIMVLLPGIGAYMICGFLLLVALEFRRRDEARGRAALEISRLIVSQLPDAIVVTNYTGSITGWMGNAGEIFGYEAEEILGEPISALFASGAEKERGEILTAMRSTGSFLGRLPMQNALGQRLDIGASMQKLHLGEPADEFRAVAVLRDITNRVRTQQALAQSEVRYQQLISAGLFPILVVSDGIITYANETCCKLLGAEHTGLDGQKLLPLFRGSNDQLLQAALNDTVSGAEIAPMRLEMIRLDGRHIDVEIKGLQIETEERTSNVFVLQDITERVSLEQRRRQSEALTRRKNRELVNLNELSRTINRSLFDPDFLQVIYEEIGQKLLQADYFATFDFDAGINKLVCTSSVFNGKAQETEIMNRQLVNTPFAYLLAIGQPRVLGWQVGYEKNFPQIASLFKAPPAEMLFMPLLVGTQLKGVIWAVGRESGQFEGFSLSWLSTLASQIAVSLENVHLLKQAQREIEERRKVEAALAREQEQLAFRVEERTMELRDANAELKVALRHREQFLATVSHELRTPLTGILGMAEALLDLSSEGLSDKQVRWLSNIESSGRHLLALINDLLDYSRIQSGRFTLDIEKTDVRGICDAAQAMIGSLAQSKALTLKLNVAPDITTMQADSRRMLQILVNLLGNAVKFTPAGGEIGLIVSQDVVANRIHFEVWDSGIGIRPEEQARIFEPFYQLDQGLDRHYGGTGLGLSLVNELVALHGGTITVTSAADQGSRFELELPLHTSAEDLPQRYELAGDARSPLF